MTVATQRAAVQIRAPRLGLLTAAAVLASAGCLVDVEEQGSFGAGLGEDRRFHSENDLPAALDRAYLPRVHAALGATIRGEGGVQLRYLVQPSPVGSTALVIVNGRAESMIMLGELLDDLASFPLTIYSYDHRGQGLSGRMLPDRNKGYVEGFDWYVSDLETFMDTIVAGGGHSRVILLGHSMGGAIATLYALRHPDRVQGLILSAPMFGVVLPARESAVRLAAVHSSPTAYAFGQGPFDPNIRFDGNGMTGSRARFDMVQRLFTRDFPAAPIGGVTWSWLLAALDADRAIGGTARNLSVDTLVLRAGYDSVVSASAMENVCRAAMSCRVSVIPGAEHEILFDRDEPRSRALGEITGFLLPSLVDR